MSNRIVSMNSVINNTKTNLFNTYIPGSGVGANSISNRRAKILRATLNKGTMENPKTGKCNGFCVNGSLPLPSGVLTYNLINNYVNLTKSNFSYIVTTRTELFELIDLYAKQNTYYTKKYGDINDWDVSLISDFSNLFNERKDVYDIPVNRGLSDWTKDLDISSWNTSNVTNMKYMFANCLKFNGDLSSWNTSNVTNMEWMFAGCLKFNGHLSKWNTGNVIDMKMMFMVCQKFNGDLSSWNTGKVTNMQRMFYGCQKFNQDLSWNTGNVIDMEAMFLGCQKFNGNISSWNTSNVIDMQYMFQYDISFNGDLSLWNTSKVTNMQYMFQDCESFNQDLSLWKTGNVIDMRGMFQECESFKQDLSNWNVKNVSNFNTMFLGCTDLLDTYKNLPETPTNSDLWNDLSGGYWYT